MRLIDRFIIKEFLGPFIFGVGAFLIVLIGVQLSPWMLRLLTRDHYPAHAVGLIFLYSLPKVVLFAFPMATMFGGLMCIATLSSHGEATAMRAGGVSLPRLARPVLLCGLLISLVTLTFNEQIVPRANDAAYRLLAQYAGSARALEHMHFAIPAKGAPDRIVYVRRFDPAGKRLEGLCIFEMRDGRLWESFDAEEANWQGKEWQLRNIEHKTREAGGAERTERIALMTYDVGKGPDELSRAKKDYIDMSMGELHGERDLLRQKPQRNSEDETDLRTVLQTIQMRYAIPWASLGFALIGIPLGLRPARATTGIGLGLSLVIVLVYYVILNTMDVVGRQGALPPAVTAWVPNFVLFSAGIGLFFSARR